MLYLIRLVFGYVRIVIEGDNPEILINRIISEGITIWSVERKGISIYEEQISPHDFVGN